MRPPDAQACLGEKVYRAKHNDRAIISLPTESGRMIVDQIAALQEQLEQVWHALGLHPRDDSPQAQWERTLTPEQFAEYRKDQQEAAYGSLLFHLQEAEAANARLQAELAEREREVERLREAWDATPSKSCRNGLRRADG